jgi:acetyl-CoA carboxylase biotin carboxyl carrier protein
VSEQSLSYEELLRIIEMIRAADGFAEFHLKIGDVELDLRKAGAALAASAPASVAAQVAGAPAAAPLVTSKAAPAARAAAKTDFAPDAVLIKSPMVGTFYRRPEPGAKPFVEVGQKVAADTTVCIIEVMKLFNSIPAGTAGTVTHVLVNDAEPVDNGQVLIVIDPKGK